MVMKNMGDSTRMWEMSLFWDKNRHDELFVQLIGSILRNIDEQHAIKLKKRRRMETESSLS